MKRLLTYILSPLLAFGVGCSDFGDIDENPNASPTASTTALLTNTLAGMGGTTTGGANFLTGLYAQYFSQTQYTDNSLYSNQDVDWGGEMAGSLYDLQNIINLNTDPETAEAAALGGSNANQIAIARILKAYRFSILTDRYGDMPYFDALQENTEPTFTSQKDIYYDLFKELTEAVAQFDGGAAVKGDIMYAGDATKWKKLANSLRLILALRVSKVEPAKGETEFRAALTASGGVIEVNADNAMLTYPGGAFQNPWFGIGGDQGVSEIVAAFMNGTDVSGDGTDSGLPVTGTVDQRRKSYGTVLSAATSSTGALLGVPYGLRREDAVQWIDTHAGWSTILSTDNKPGVTGGTDYRAEDAVLYVLTAADVTLARAEGDLLGWSDDLETLTAVELYDNALRLSWEQWGVYVDTEPATVAQFTSFINDADISIDPIDAPGITLGQQFERLGIQRWLTFYPNGPQGWSEWRRTGFPALLPTPDAVNTSKQIPVRFPFPSVEYNYNQVNVATAVTRMGGTDRDDTKVWWDVN